MILGCHVSYGKEGLLGCAKEAISYGANTFMFYTGAPQNTLRKPLEESIIQNAHKYMKENKIDIQNVVCHAPYIVNLANQSNYEKWLFSIEFLKQEMIRCEKLGITKIVLHPGSAVGISPEFGIKHIIEALNLIVSSDTNCQILLETMAGKGTECGVTLDEIKCILDGVNCPSKFGVCLDTCHLHDAGYILKDFDCFLKKFDDLIGISKIQCVHLNDSKNECATHKDRHENIGCGHLGFDTLLSILNHPAIKKVPKILETPYVSITDDEKKRVYPPYRFEIMMLKEKQFHKNLLQEIRDFYKNA
ncbi:MAG: deoxyribonuclease IV [Bacilli bacterium]|jgi:deoxyribonuclease-4|nr:deoxyribonuclease IV [Bacilli bacterium]